MINWKSVGAAVTSALYMLAVAPYTLGDAAAIIPPTWKPKVFGVCLSIGFLLRVWNSRQQTIQPTPIPNQTTKIT